MRTLVGATRGGSDNTCGDDNISKQMTSHLSDQFSEHTPRSTSCSLLQKLCSNKVYMIRPRPNEGSMTFGVNSRTIQIKGVNRIRKADLRRFYLRKDLLDCLNVLRSIVSISEVSSNSFPSEILIIVFL